MIRSIKTLTAAFILLFVALFVYQNHGPLNAPIAFKFDFSLLSAQSDGNKREMGDRSASLERSDAVLKTREFPAVVWFLVFFIAGILSSGIYGALKRTTSGIEIRRLRKKLKLLQGELAEHKTITMEAPPPARSETSSSSSSDQEDNPTL